MLFYFCDFFWIRHHHRRRHKRVDIREPEVDCYHFSDRRRTNLCAGSKVDLGEGDQDGRAKGPQNNQQRQGQDPNLLRNGQVR